MRKWSKGRICKVSLWQLKLSKTSQLIPKRVSLSFLWLWKVKFSFHVRRVLKWIKRRNHVQMLCKLHKLSLVIQIPGGACRDQNLDQNFAFLKILFVFLYYFFICFNQVCLIKLACFPNFLWGEIAISRVSVADVYRSEHLCPVCTKRKKKFTWRL